MNCRVVKMATENPRWGYDRIVGERKKNGIRLSASSVANILEAHGILGIKRAIGLPSLFTVSRRENGFPGKS